MAAAIGGTALIICALMDKSRELENFDCRYALR